MSEELASIRIRFRIPTYIGILDYILEKLERRKSIEEGGGSETAESSAESEAIRETRNHIETGLLTKAINLLEAPIDMEEFISLIVRNYVLKYNDSLRKGPIVLVSTEEHPAGLIDVIASKANWNKLRDPRSDDYKLFKKYVKIVNASNLNEIGDSTGIVNMIMRKRRYAIEKDGTGSVSRVGGLVIFYTLSKLALFWKSWDDPSEVIKLINKIKYEAKQNNFAVLLGVDPNMHDQRFINMIERLSDLTVKITINYDRGIPERFIMAESRKAQLLRKNEYHPYVLVPRLGIFTNEELEQYYDYKGIMSMYYNARKKLAKTGNILTGIYPIDYDPQTKEIRGVPTEEAYMIYYSSYSDLYPLVITMIDVLMKFSNQTLYIVFVEDSVEGFLEHFFLNVEDIRFKMRLISRLGRSIFFLDATKSDVERVKRKFGLTGIEEEEAEKEEVYTPVKNLNDPENLAEIVFYIERFHEYKRQRDPRRSGTIVLFLTLSALVSKTDVDRSFRAISYLISKYTWTTGSEMTFFMFMNPRALREEDMNRFKALVGGEIILDTREIFGHTVNYMRILRLPGRPSYFVEWIPYISYTKYPPGIIFNKVEFTELAIKGE